MKLTKLGKYIELLENRNSDLKYGAKDVRGINNLKKMMPTRADMSGRKFDDFSVVYPNDFVFNHRTSRNGDKFSITYNYENRPYIFTEDYVVFRIIDTDVLLPEWLYMYVCRPEFDRYVITNSWGSSTEFYNWEDLCDVDIAIPPMNVQKKYVSVYNSIVANQASYESGLEDLKLMCDAFVENQKKVIPLEKIGPYLIESDRRNDLNMPVESVRGLSTSKEMIPTKADMDGVSLRNYKVVEPGQIAYVADTSRRGDKVSMGINITDETFLVSSISIVFGTKTEKLLPEYLMLFLTRSEFDRYARFNSWGSARETFTFDDMCDVEIPIPELKVQRAISDIYKVYIKRKEINEILKNRVTEICSILIKGSIEEAS